MLQSVAQQFNQGGPFMWVILATFGFSLAVVIERFFYFFVYCRGSSESVVSRILAAMGAGKFDQARAVLQKRSAPLYVLLRTALDRHVAGASPERVMESVEQVAIKEIPRISQRVSYLSLIANVATLLGLLGTITGLQVSFSSLATVDAAQKASMLASGISQAMNTTAFGLIVAVPCMVLYTALHNKQQQIVKDIDEGIARFMNTIKESHA